MVEVHYSFDKLYEMLAEVQEGLKVKEKEDILLKEIDILLPPPDLEEMASIEDDDCEDRPLLNLSNNNVLSNGKLLNTSNQNGMLPKPVITNNRNGLSKEVLLNPSSENGNLDQILTSSSHQSNSLIEPLLNLSKENGALDETWLGTSNQGFVIDGPSLNKSTNQDYVLQEPFSNLSNHDYTLEEEPLLDMANPSELVETPSYSVITYKRRWLILFIFSMNTMMNGLLFMSLTPINNIAVKYYRVPSVQIEWLSNMFTVIYIILALPSSYVMTKWGVRPVIMIASSLHFISASFHYAGYHRDRFWLVLSGQGVAALAYCMILQIPGKLSSVWFPENEGATATSIGVFMNLFGISVGFLQPSMMVEESENLDVIQNGLIRFFCSQLIMTGSILFLTLAYKEQPPTPARSHTYNEAIDFSTSLKLLWRNKDFIVLSQSYGIYFGLFITFSVLVNPLITWKFPHGYDTSLGWMGFSCDMAAIFACLFIGIMLDIYRVYRLTAILLNVFSMLVWLSFVLVLTNTTDFTSVFILYVAVGLFGVPYFASGIEQAAEMTYPVSEETSSTIILILGNLYGFIFVAVLGFEAEINHTRITGYTMVVLYFVSALLAFFTKTELKRSNKGRTSIQKETG